MHISLAKPQLSKPEFRSSDPDPYLTKFYTCRSPNQLAAAALALAKLPFARYT